MTLDKYIKILEDIKAKEGGDIEVSRVIRDREIHPVPKVGRLVYETNERVQVWSPTQKQWDASHTREKKVILI